MPERKIDLQLSRDEIKGIVELLSVAEKPILERCHEAIVETERQALADKIEFIKNTREYLKGFIIRN